MKRELGFLFDVNRCIGCKSCEEACLNEHYQNDGLRFRRVETISPGIYLSQSCNHCDSPECFRVCPNRAYMKRRDGIVQVNPHRCNGCRTCQRACPYGAPQYNLTKNKVDKCDLCLPRLQQGSWPACVTACHTGALKVIDLERIQQKGLLTRVEGLPDIRLTRPSTRYLPFKVRKRYWQDKPLDKINPGS